MVLVFVLVLVLLVPVLPLLVVLAVVPGEFVVNDGNLSVDITTVIRQLSENSAETRT